MVVADPEPLARIRRPDHLPGPGLIPVDEFALPARLDDPVDQARTFAAASGSERTKAEYATD